MKINTTKKGKGPLVNEQISQAIDVLIKAMSAYVAPVKIAFLLRKYILLNIYNILKTLQKPNITKYGC